jgi:hypothetical protein
MSTYAKFDQSHTDDARWIAAGADAFALHVAAVVWCDRLLTDGVITKDMALRVSLAVPPDRATAAVQALLDQGFWVVTEDVPDELRIVSFPEHAFPAEQVKRTRARWALDKQRKRQHDLGDHALCKDPRYCPAIREDSRVDSTGGLHMESTRIDQTRPDQDQTRPEEGEVGAGIGMGGSRGSTPGGGSAGAPPAASAPPLPGDNDADADPMAWTPRTALPPGVIPKINGRPAFGKGSKPFHPYPRGWVERWGE